MLDDTTLVADQWLIGGHSADQGEVNIERGSIVTRQNESLVLVVGSGGLDPDIRRLRKGVQGWPAVLRIGADGALALRDGPPRVDFAADYGPQEGGSLSHVPSAVRSRARSPRASRVRLEVFDLRGRRVRTGAGRR